MGRRLESINSKKALDANVEANGANEIGYDDESYNYLFEEDEPVVQPIWNGQDVGRATIGVPAQDKKTAQMYEEAEEIAKKDKVNPDLQKKFDEIADELEGIF